ncbi:thioredoxin 1 [Geosmithia morbida]|uniref:Thioredoxin n=1 Tax=Geosmithia morbida TaxID=1094350 RepID=A0A9P4Z2C8_9HYPO|nr:thioredoxin 1 [Geosmithia morbida]KAF4126897.1 thioredoxin 1 [Geosmithia morbida]
MTTWKDLECLDEFKALVDSGDKIIVDFKAVWCGPCKAISPIFEKLSDSADFENIKFVTVDVDEAPEISQEVGVSAMPTFITFNGGNKVGTLTGAIPAKLEELIKSVHAL